MGMHPRSFTMDLGAQDVGLQDELFLQLVTVQECFNDPLLLNSDVPSEMDGRSVIDVRRGKNSSDIPITMLGDTVGQTGANMYGPVEGGISASRTVNRHMEGHPTHGINDRYMPASSDMAAFGHTNLVGTMGSYLPRSPDPWLSAPFMTIPHGGRHAIQSNLPTEMGYAQYHTINPGISPMQIDGQVNGAYEQAIQYAQYPQTAEPSSGEAPRWRTSSTHQNTHAKVSKSYTCNNLNCGATFQRSSDLSRHCRSKHQSERYKCPMCDKDFCRKDALKVHMRNLHRQ